MKTLIVNVLSRFALADREKFDAQVAVLQRPREQLTALVQPVVNLVNSQ